MHHLIDATVFWFSGFIHQNLFFAYLIEYLSTLLLGNIGAFGALWLAFHGGLGAWGVPLTLATLFVADLSLDFFSYSLGRLLTATRFSGFIRRHIPRLEKLEVAIQENTRKWILMAKFLYFSNFFILFAVGWTKIDFKRYFRSSLRAVTLWLAFVTVLAYSLFTSLSLVHVELIARRLELVFIAGLISFIIINFVVRRLVQYFLGDRKV